MLHAGDNLMAGRWQGFVKGLALLRGRPRVEVPRSAAGGCGGMQLPGPGRCWRGGVEHSHSPHPQHSAWCRAVPSQPSLHEHSVLHPHYSTWEGPGCLHTPPFPCFCSFRVNKRRVTCP